MDTGIRRTACPSSKYPSTRPSLLRRRKQVELDLVAVEVDAMCDLKRPSDSLVVIQSDDHAAHDFSSCGFRRHLQSTKKEGLPRLPSWRRIPLGFHPQGMQRVLCLCTNSFEGTGTNPFFAPIARHLKNWGNWLTPKASKTYSSEIRALVKHLVIKSGEMVSRRSWLNQDWRPGQKGSPTTWERQISHQTKT